MNEWMNKSKTKENKAKQNLHEQKIKKDRKNQ